MYQPPVNEYFPMEYDFPPCRPAPIEEPDEQFLVSFQIASFQHEVKADANIINS